MTNISTSLLVVAAALLDERLRVLMHRRPLGSAHGGLWEFPGGKVEPGESPEAALSRELSEELGIAVNDSDLRPLGFASGRSASETGLVILLYTCRRWAGHPRCLVGEEMDWFAPDAVSALAMPPLDYPLAEQLACAWRNKSL